MEGVNFDSLSLLLKASSKDDIQQLCCTIFSHRNSPNFPDFLIRQTIQSFSLSEEESVKLLTSLRALIKNAVYQGSSDGTLLRNLFPESFHKQLADLLVKILSQNLPQWMESAVNNMVSLPKLVGFNWRVDTKVASDSLSQMSVPTCILQLQIAEPYSGVDVVPRSSNVCVELSPETLDTMLDGLTKIRDQLSSVATTT